MNQDHEPGANQYFGEKRVGHDEMRFWRKNERSKSTNRNQL